jgi:ribonuclease HII
MDPNGNYVSHVTVIKGDSTYYSIAAASILAKWTRDQYIEQLCKEYPELQIKYGIRDNKGYLSAQAHKDGLAEHGYCQFHRKTWKTFTDLKFNPVPRVEPIVRVKPVIRKREPTDKIDIVNIITNKS